VLSCAIVLSAQGASKPDKGAQNKSFELQITILSSGKLKSNTGIKVQILVTIAFTEAPKTICNLSGTD
jgi:hypothetical protein